MSNWANERKNEENYFAFSGKLVLIKGKCTIIYKVFIILHKSCIEAERAILRAKFAIAVTVEAAPTLPPMAIKPPKEPSGTYFGISSLRITS